jgi:starvation-inducible DNA-binding protein
MSTPIDIGIPEAQRRTIADGLDRLLADTYTLYLKTHNFHWNVEGPMFSTLHQMFETQYTELALAVDLIAERIRALGFRAPGSYREFAAPPLRPRGSHHMADGPWRQIRPLAQPCRR